MNRGAIFDMDGTLIDTEKLYQEGWLSVAHTFGLKPSLDLAHSVSGTSGEQMYAVVRRFYPDVDIAEYVRRVISYVDDKTSKEIRLMTGVKDILQFFKDQGVKMAVASASPKDIIKRNLTNAGIIDYFDTLVSGEEVNNGKPAPDIFLCASKRIDIAAKECYVFEDSLNGIKAAVAAKCTAIMIPDTVQPDELTKKTAAAIYPSLAEALAAVRDGRI